MQSCIPGSLASALWACSARQEAREFFGLLYGHSPGFTGVHSALSPPVGFLYHSNGMLASAMHANGVRDSVTVDATTWLRRPKRLETLDVLSNRNFVAGDYAYDASGNIKAIGADLFKYDKVSRLTEGTVRVPAWVTPAQPARTQGYSFDDFGNITAVTGTNARNTPTSDLTSRLTGTGTSYDEAGNLTSHNGTNYQYDRLNVLKRMTTAAGAAQEDWIYVYTADDERLWSYRVGGGGSLWSLRDLAGQVIRQFEAHTSWSTTRDYVHRDGQLFATVLPTGAVQHYHLDHLGTPRLLTDASKAAVANFTYFPFGEEVAGGTVSAERMRFTGHERDLNNAGGAGDDLDYMHARFHSPVTGRFLSTDPSARSIRLGMPQSWNRYNYVMGNPLKYIDPYGLAWFLIEGKWRYLKDQDQIGIESKDKNGNPVLTVIRGRDRFVSFTGGSLILYDRDGSRKLFGAVSGRVGPGGQTDSRLQAARNRGPIPEGRYYFNPANVQSFSDLSLAEKIASLVPPPIWKLGPWPGGLPAWGNQRVELSADPSTNTYGRSGFFIHGGLTPGSAGCIDLCDRDVDFFSAVGTSADDITVEVDYP